MATVINTAMVCVACDGQGKTVGYACPGFRRIEMACAPCGGSGVAPPWQAEAVARGTVLRNERMARNVSQREEAKRIGVDVVVLSQAENGRRPVSEWPEVLK